MVIVGSGTLPPPILNLPSVLPVNARISASYPAGYTIAGYQWSITRSTTSAAGVPAFAARSSAQASSANFSTASGTADLAPLTLVPGAYLIAVQAVGSSNSLSAPAQALVTLVAADLSSVRVFPNPWRADKHSGNSITFDQLSLNSSIKIFTVSGHWIKTLPTSSASVTWDLTNDSGDKVAAGLYVYLVTDDQGQKSTGKVAIIR